MILSIYRVGHTFISSTPLPATYPNPTSTWSISNRPCTAYSQPTSWRHRCLPLANLMTVTALPPSPPPGLAAPPRTPCTTSPAWRTPNFRSEDCVEAVERFLYTDYKHYKGTRLVFHDRAPHRRPLPATRPCSSPAVIPSPPAPSSSPCCETSRTNRLCRRCRAVQRARSSGWMC